MTSNCALKNCCHILKGITIILLQMALPAAFPLDNCISIFFQLFYEEIKTIVFNVLCATVSRKWLPQIDGKMHGLIFWPEREALQKTMPQSFQQSFGKKVTVIIEIFIERSSNLKETQYLPTEVLTLQML